MFLKNSDVDLKKPMTVKHPSSQGPQTPTSKKKAVKAVQAPRKSYSLLMISGIARKNK